MNRLLGLFSLPLLALAGCTSTGESPVETQTNLLLRDGQFVNLNMNTGPAAQIAGSRGLGKFRQGYDAERQVFGPARVLSHTATELRFKGQRNDCLLKSGGTVTCKDGSTGTWS